MFLSVFGKKKKLSSYKQKQRKKKLQGKLRGKKL